MADMEQKSTAGITALGMACVILGAIWLIASLWGFLEAGTIRAETERVRAPQLLAEGAMWIPYVDAAANVLLAGVLFAAGVGLLRLRSWGRRLGIGYAWARIGWSVVALVLAFLGPYSHRPSVPESGLRSAFETFMAERFAPVARTEMFAGFVLSVVFPVILLCLLKRKSYEDTLS